MAETFEELGIATYLIEKLNERYIIKPTAIQELVIPKLLEGKNVLFRSATGTGKTFAYLLPIIQLAMSNEIKIMICSPTLELCSQIKNEVDCLLQTFTIAHCSLLTAHFIIGTPGKLLSLAKMRKFNISDLKFLVLDEADRLITKDCIEDTKGLLSIIKKHARALQVAGCSATVNKKTCEKLGPLFKDAQIIESDDQEILREQIEHWAIFGERRKRTQTLRSFISAVTGQTRPKGSGKSKKSKIKMLIFTSKNDDAALIHAQLMHHKIAAGGLYAKVGKKPLSPEQRKASLDSFRRGDTHALVATDLAARGLDIPGITHVIALDVPDDADFYIHRAGRTGRAGKRGIMVTIGDETQMRLLSLLEKKLKIRIIPKELYGGRILPVAFSA